MKKIILIILLSFFQFGFSQSDCITAISVCGNSSISYTPTGLGIQELNSGNTPCGFTEQKSVWYSFTINTAGTLTFLITPNNPANDYDFYLFGPNVTCGAMGSSIRCSVAIPGVSAGLTGLTATATATSDPVGGTGYAKYLDVLPGQTYFLCVNNYSASAEGFSLTFGGTATLVSPFNNPVLTPNPFIAPGPAHNGIVTICTNPAVFDFSTLSSGIINGNPNFSVSYYNTANDALLGTSPITIPITVNTTNTYYYNIQYTDPTNPLNPINSCKNTGTIKFIQGAITVNNATITTCNNNNAGTGLFDLTSVATTMYADPTATRKYYPTLTDMNAGTNEILVPQAMAYTSAAGTIYVKVTTTMNCTNFGIITLQFYPIVSLVDASLTTCFLEANHATGTFNLNNATVGGGTLTKAYYPSYTDAVNGTNAIATPAAFISPSTVVYVKGTNSNGCTGISKITLTVTPPIYSTVLLDKVICAENNTTLDAGAGFSAYLWSTGATTQTISNVSIGSYWVDLTKGLCTTRQKVIVAASTIPIVSAIDITDNTITVSVTGGTPPYQYSIDNVNWQASNVFSNVVRGKNIIYVKDSFNCIPIAIEVTVPNLINAITPNGDGVNDYIDYSSLAYKDNLVFNIYDRYGNKIQTVDKSNGYKWDGKMGNKKLSTGTYWYSVTWNEADLAKTPVKFSGWVLLKNK